MMWHYRRVSFGFRAFGRCLGESCVLEHGATLDTLTLARVSVVPTELREFFHTSDLRVVV